MQWTQCDQKLGYKNDFKLYSWYHLLWTYIYWTSNAGYILIFFGLELDAGFSFPLKWWWWWWWWWVCLLQLLHPQISSTMVPQSSHPIWLMSPYRPECVAGVNDSTGRRWRTFEVSVSNLWKDNDGSSKDEASCWGASRPLSNLHCLPETVQDQEFPVGSLFPDTQEPSHVPLGNNMKLKIL